MRICPFRPIGLSRREPVVERCPARQLVEYPLTLVGDRFWKSKQRRLAPRSARGLIAARPGRPRLRADDFAFFDQFAKVIADLGNSPAEQLGDPARGRPPPVVPLRPGRQRRIAFDHRRGESLADSAAKCGRPNEHRPILPGSLDGDLGTSIPVTNNCDVEELGGEALGLDGCSAWPCRPPPFVIAGFALYEGSESWRATAYDCCRARPLDPLSTEKGSSRNRLTLFRPKPL
jgi:hypothetical protein